MTPRFDWRSCNLPPKKRIAMFSMKPTWGAHAESDQRRPLSGRNEWLWNILMRNPRPNSAEPPWLGSMSNMPVNRIETLVAGKHQRSETSVFWNQPSFARCCRRAPLGVGFAPPTQRTGMLASIPATERLPAFLWTAGVLGNPGTAIHAVDRRSTTLRLALPHLWLSAERAAESIGPLEIMFS